MKFVKTLLITIFGAAFLGFAAFACGYVLFRGAAVSNTLSLDNLRKDVVTETPAESSDASSDASGYTVDFEALNEINSDVFGWLVIPGTEVEYPVVCGSGKTGDDYYLLHTFDSKSGYPGTIYSRNPVTLSDDGIEENVTILYGHNMRDGSMFADLSKYCDADYLTGHTRVYLYLENGITYEYRVFAAYTSDSLDLWDVYDSFETRSDVKSYMEDITGTASKSGVLRKDNTAEFSDKILTLSTCLDDSSVRFLVQCYLVK